MSPPEREPRTQAAAASSPRAWRARVVAAALACGALAVALARPDATPWAVALLVVALGWSGWRWWYDTRGPGATLAHLRARWGTLHGAAPTARGISVYDGVQPIDVRLAAQGSSATATVLTRLEDDVLAFRLWPDGQSAPPFPEGTTRADLARAHAVEARFANLIRVEGNDQTLLARRLLGDTLAPVLVVRREAGDAFRGLTWDGRQLAVHWQGPHVADPQRILAWSRPIWRAFVELGVPV